MRSAFVIFVASMVAAGLVACGGKRPESLGVTESKLAPCPETPNCVSSDADVLDLEHAIEPFALAADPDVAWVVALEVVAARPRTEIIHHDSHYLHAECTSRLMRYVDDLELQLRPEANVIAVRSASRIGRSDLGVNRERVESIRAALRERGVVE